MEQLDEAPVVVEQRRQAPADADVHAHPGVRGVHGVHVVAFLVGDHLQGQLVVVAQEDAPLGRLGDLGRGAHDLHDRLGLLAPRRHEHAGHDGEVEGHVALVPVALAEVLHDVLGPLVGLGQQDAVVELGVDDLADLLEVGVGLGQVLAVGPLAGVQVGDRIQPQAVQAHVQPEPHHVHHRRADLGVVVVEVGLVAEEAVPVVLAGLGVPGPVRRLGVDEDDPRVAEPLRVV